MSQDQRPERSVSDTQPGTNLPGRPSTARPIRVVDTLPEESNVINDHIFNCHEKEFVTEGVVNCIHTDIVLDTGASRSIISQNFISNDMSPVDTVRVYGMSQVVVQLQTYDVQIDMPGLSGTCCFAMNPVLPQNTVLLGSDLGREKLLELLNGLKHQPKPVLAVTRARTAENALASKFAEVKHVSEGACPLALEDILELNLESAAVP